jgi:hypothetical protein
MSTRPDERHIQAIHEAGHAVVAHIQGFLVEKVEYTPTGARIGLAVDMTNPKDEDEAMRLLFVMVAGYLAVKMAGFPDSLLMSEMLDDQAGRLKLNSDPMWASCLVDAVCRMRQQGPASLEYTVECVKNAEKFAREMLERRWTAVNAVGTALLKGTAIGGNDICAIIDT